MRQWWKEHGRKWAFRLCGLALTAAVAVSLLPEAVVVPASAVTQAEIDAMREEADDLKDQQKEIQAKLDALEEDQANAMERKTLLEQQINATQAEINTIAAQIAKYDELIAQKQEELSQAEAEEQAQYELFCERVVHGGTGGGLLLVHSVLLQGLCGPAGQRHDGGGDHGL